MLRKVEIALAQLKATLYDKETNLTRAAEAIVMAKNMGADYCIFPELFLTGYYIKDRVYDLAEDLSGSSIKRVCSLAKENNIAVIMGFPQKWKNKFYNSAAFIDRQGDILGVYQKVHLFHEEKLYFTPGEDFPVFETADGKFGILICYDSEFPESARILALKGAQIILSPTANMVPYQHHQETYMVARALENHVFMITVNKVGLEEDTIFFGESTVAGPDGTLLHKSSNNEEVVKVTINMNQISETKGVLDYLNNRQPHLYKKLVTLD
jgi:predicted amidohydrolase